MNLKSAHTPQTHTFAPLFANGVNAGPPSQGEASLAEHRAKIAAMPEHLRPLRTIEYVRIAPINKQRHTLGIIVI